MENERQPFSGAPAGSLRVLQITDTHLYEEAEGRLLGLNTLQSLGAVVAQVCDRIGGVDLILATGDLVHDATPQGYRRARRCLNTLHSPVYCLPGNHDSPERMAENIQGGRVRMPASAVHGDWLLVLLDSTVADRDGGHLDADQLGHLDRALAAAPDRHALVCLHHQPVPIGSAWMDTMALDNGEDFFRVIDRHPAVRGILWGHIHQTFEAQRNGVRLMGSPSTCIQFAPGSEAFGIDEEPPGYRWLLLHPDGRIDSGVERLPQMPEGIDMDSGGY